MGLDFNFNFNLNDVTLDKLYKDASNNTTTDFSYSKNVTPTSYSHSINKYGGISNGNVETLDLSSLGVNSKDSNINVDSLMENNNSKILSVDDDLSVGKNINDNKGKSVNQNFKSSNEKASTNIENKGLNGNENNKILDNNIKEEQKSNINENFKNKQGSNSSKKFETSTGNTSVSGMGNNSNSSSNNTSSSTTVNNGTNNDNIFDNIQSDFNEVETGEVDEVGNEVFTTKVYNTISNVVSEVDVDSYINSLVKYGLRMDDINRVLNGSISLDSLMLEIQNDTDTSRKKEIMDASYLSAYGLEISNMKALKLEIDNLKKELENLIKEKNSIDDYREFESLMDIIVRLKNGENLDSILSSQIVAWKYTDENGNITYCYDSPTASSIAESGKNYKPLYFEDMYKNSDILDDLKKVLTKSTTKSLFSDEKKDVYIWDGTKNQEKFFESLLQKYESNNLNRKEKLEELEEKINKYQEQLSQYSNLYSTITNEVDYYLNYVDKYMTKEDFELNNKCSINTSDILEKLSKSKNNITISDSFGGSISKTYVNEESDLVDVLMCMINDTSLVLSGANGVVNLDSDNNILENFKKWIPFLTESEKEVINYIYNTEGSSQVYQYLENISKELDNRYVADKTQKDQEYASEHPVLASLASIVVTPIEGLGAACYSINSLIRKEEIRKTNTYSSGDVWRNQVANDIAQNYGGGWSFLYSTGMSMADSVSMIGVTVATGGVATPVISASLMGSRAYVSTLNDALDRGLSDGQAVGLAFSSAVVETAMESYSLGHLMNLETKLGEGTSKLVLKVADKIPNEALANIATKTTYIASSAISQGLAEGEEEFATEILNFVFDDIISGDLSNHTLTINNYISLGYTEEEARQLANMDFSSQLGQAFLGGFVSGICFGSFGGVTTTHNVSKNIAKNIEEKYNGNSAKAFAEGIEINRILQENSLNEYNKNKKEQLLSLGNKIKSLFNQKQYNVKSNDHIQDIIYNINKAYSIASQSGSINTLISKAKGPQGKVAGVELFNILGYNAKPTSITNDEFQKLSEESKYGVIVRGIAGPDSKEYVNQLKNGEMYVGGEHASIKGTGIYTGFGLKSKEIGEKYSTRSGTELNGEIVEMLLDSSANVVEYDTIVEEQNKVLDEMSKKYSKYSSDIKDFDTLFSNLDKITNTNELQEAKFITNFLADTGYYAALNGYDAIVDSKVNYLTVLNRGKLYVKEDKVNNLNNEEVEVIKVADLDTSINEFDRYAVNLNTTYIGYDYVVKPKGDLNAILEQIIKNNDGSKILIQLTNINGLTLEMLEKVPNNIDFRIIDYNIEFYQIFRKNRQKAMEAVNEYLTYSKNELQLIINELNNIKKGIDENWNNYQKAKYVYDYMVNNIEYQKPSSIIGRHKHFDGLMSLVDKISTCNGFAHTYSAILNNIGINCSIVWGNMNGEGNHAYNIVSIDGNNFIVDTTRESINKDKPGEFEGTGFGVQNIEQYAAVSNTTLFESVNSTFDSILNKIDLKNTEETDETSKELGSKKASNADVDNIINNLDNFSKWEMKRLLDSDSTILIELFNNQKIIDYVKTNMTKKDILNYSKYLPNHPLISSTFLSLTLEEINDLGSWNIFHLYKNFPSNIQKQFVDLHIDFFAKELNTFFSKKLGKSGFFAIFDKLGSYEFLKSKIWSISDLDSEIQIELYDKYKEVIYNGSQKDFIQFAERLNDATYQANFIKNSPFFAEIINSTEFGNLLSKIKSKKFALDLIKDSEAKIKMEESPAAFKNIVSFLSLEEQYNFVEIAKKQILKIYTSSDFVTKMNGPTSVYLYISGFDKIIQNELLNDLEVIESMPIKIMIELNEKFQGVYFDKMKNMINNNFTAESAKLLFEPSVFELMDQDTINRAALALESFEYEKLAKLGNIEAIGVVIDKIVANNFSEIKNYSTSSIIYLYNAADEISKQKIEDNIPFNTLINTISCFKGEQFTDILVNKFKLSNEPIEISIDDLNEISQFKPESYEKIFPYLSSKQKLVTFNFDTVTELGIKEEFINIFRENATLINYMNTHYEQPLNFLKLLSTNDDIELFYSNIELSTLLNIRALSKSNIINLEKLKNILKDELPSYKFKYTSEFNHLGNILDNYSVSEQLEILNTMKSESKYFLLLDGNIKNKETKLEMIKLILNDSNFRKSINNNNIKYLKDFLENLEVEYIDYILKNADNYFLGFMLSLTRRNDLNLKFNEMLKQDDLVLNKFEYSDAELIYENLSNENKVLLDNKINSIISNIDNEQINLLLSEATTAQKSSFLGAYTKGILTNEKIDFLLTLKQKNKYVLSTFNYNLFDDTIYQLGPNLLSKLSKYYDVVDQIVELKSNSEKFNLFANMIISNNDSSVLVQDQKIAMILDYLLENELDASVLNYSNMNDVEIARNIILKDIDMFSLLGVENTGRSIIKLEEYNISNYYEELSNKCDSLLKEATTVEEVQNLIFNKYFSISIEDAQKLFKIYGSNFSNIKNLDTNGIATTYLENMYNILNASSMEEAIDLYNTFNSNYNMDETLTIINEIKQIYTRSLKETLFVPKDIVDYVDYNGIKIPVYAPKGDFQMLVHSTAAYGQMTLINDNYFDSWNLSNRTANHGICCSLISNNNMGLAEINDILLGFNNFTDEQINMMAPYDIYTRNDGYLIKSGRPLLYLPGKDVMNETRHTHNEFNLERTNLTGEGNLANIQPDYVIIFDDMDIELKNKAYKASIEFNIPLVYLNRENLAINEKNKIDSLISEFNTTYDVKLLKDILVLHENNRSGYRVNKPNFVTQYFQSDKIIQILNEGIENAQSKEDLLYIKEILEEENAKFDATHEATNRTNIIDIPIEELLEKIDDKLNLLNNNSNNSINMENLDNQVELINKILEYDDEQFENFINTNTNIDLYKNEKIFKRAMSTGMNFINRLYDITPRSESFSDFYLDQLLEYEQYADICEQLFKLVNNIDSLLMLKGILYDGAIGNYSIRSNINCKDSPDIEITRRVSMAYLFINNSETFKALVDNNINVFHGTNGNALPNIISYGMNSVSEAKRREIDVTTGENWSRISGERDFISFTDVLEIAEYYSFTTAINSNPELDFNVIIGTSTDKLSNIQRIGSDISEFGVGKHIDLEQIKCICVPNDKVEYVKKLLNNDKILVLGLSNLEDKFYYLDDSYCLDYNKDMLNNWIKTKFSSDNSEVKNLNLQNFDDIESNVQGAFDVLNDEVNDMEFALKPEHENDTVRLISIKELLNIIKNNNIYDEFTTHKYFNRNTKYLVSDITRDEYLEAFVQLYHAIKNNNYDLGLNFFQKLRLKKVYNFALNSLEISKIQYDFSLPNDIKLRIMFRNKKIYNSKDLNILYNYYNEKFPLEKLLKNPKLFVSEEYSFYLDVLTKYYEHNEQQLVEKDLTFWNNLVKNQMYLNDVILKNNIDLGEKGFNKFISNITFWSKKINDYVTYYGSIYGINIENLNYDSKMTNYLKLELMRRDKIVYDEALLINKMNQVILSNVPSIIICDELYWLYYNTLSKYYNVGNNKYENYYNMCEKKYRDSLAYIVNNNVQLSEKQFIIFMRELGNNINIIKIQNYIASYLRKHSIDISKYLNKIIYKETLPKEIKLQLYQKILENADWYLNDNSSINYGVNQNSVALYMKFRIDNLNWLDEENFKEYLINKHKYKIEDADGLLEKIKERVGKSIDPRKGSLILEYIYEKCLSDNRFDVLDVVNNSFSFKFSDEFKRLALKLENLGMNELDSLRILSAIDSTGCCSYASVLNGIFMAYRNNPSAFERDFGYPMYIDVNGNKELNSGELMIDVYTFINSNKCGGSLFIYEDDGTLKINDLTTEKQIYITTVCRNDDVYHRDDLINAFLKFKNANSKYVADKSVYFGEGKVSNMHILAIKEAVTNFLMKVPTGSVELGLWQTKNHEFRLLNNKKEVYKTTNSWSEGAGHAVCITGVLDKYFIISSWGKRLFIPIEDFINNEFNIIFRHMEGIE